jgi:hypothetical protein
MPAVGSFGAVADGIEGITSALRPTIRASHRPTLGTGSVKDGATASIAGWCEAEDGSAAGEQLPRARLFQFSGLQIYGEANVGTI